MWAFSTAKLESRGKRMKKVARKQTSNRKTSSETKTIIKKKERGGKLTKHRKEGVTEYTVKGYKGNKCLSMLGKTTFREEYIFSANAAPSHRKREQLLTLGKQDIAPKVKLEKEGRWGALIPSDVEFTVVGLLAAMVSGKIKPLYSLEGVCQAPK